MTFLKTEHKQIMRKKKDCPPNVVNEVIFHPTYLHFHNLRFTNQMNLLHCIQKISISEITISVNAKKYLVIIVFATCCISHTITTCRKPPTIAKPLHLNSWLLDTPLHHIFFHSRHFILYYSHYC